MATRSEQFHAEEQRKGRARPKKKSSTKKAGGRIAKKATFALERSPGKRPSRKSTRKSANRSKPQHTLEIREEIQKGSPERKAERARVRQR
jgi:hypothetical protein